jgi:hypothetical protein
MYGDQKEVILVSEFQRASAGYNPNIPKLIKTPYSSYLTVEYMRDVLADQDLMFKGNFSGFDQQGGVEFTDIY